MRTLSFLLIFPVATACMKQPSTSAPSDQYDDLKSLREAIENEGIVYELGEVYSDMQYRQKVVAELLANDHALVKELGALRKLYAIKKQAVGYRGNSITYSRNLYVILGDESTVERAPRAEFILLSDDKNHFNDDIKLTISTRKNTSGPTQSPTETIRRQIEIAKALVDTMPKDYDEQVIDYFGENVNGYSGVARRIMFATESIKLDDKLFGVLLSSIRSLDLKKLYGEKRRVYLRFGYRAEYVGQTDHIKFIKLEPDIMSTFEKEMRSAY